MHIDMPGVSPLIINTIILDLNGTLAIDGIVIEGAAERIEHLKKMGLDLLLFTGNAGEMGRVSQEILAWNFE